MNKKFITIVFSVLCIISINKCIFAENIIDSNLSNETKNSNVSETLRASNINVENGFYKIISKNNNVLDVMENKTTANAIVGLWISKGSANQRFKIEQQNNNTYKITAVHSGLVLEVSGNRVKQNKDNGSNTQKWMIENRGEYYYLKSVSSGLYITEEKNSNITLSELNSSKNQGFKLHKEASLKGNRTIDDGYYIIKSSVNQSKVFDVNGVSKNNAANIQLWTCNYGTNQIFELKYNQATGTYVIKSPFSGKVFDLPYAGKENCTNVQQYDCHNSEWQRWLIEKTTDGYYSISSICNGLYIDVSGNSTLNGTNIEMYQGHKGQNQKFLFEKINIPSNSTNVTDGIYQVISSMNNKVFDVLEAKTIDGAVVGLYQNNMNLNQKFRIKRNSRGYYSIINMNSELYLEADGTELKQRKQDNNTVSQDWILVDINNGYYNIISRCSGSYITISGNNGLELSKKSGSNMQRFKLDKKASTECKQIIPDGYYFIESSIDKNKVLDIESASIKAEANVILWSKNSRNNQKFKFTYDGNGHYVITSAKSKKVLDVAFARKDNGSNVQQYNNQGNDWQKWVIEKNSDGTYSIISVHNGLTIDLPYSSTKNGTNIQLYSGNGGRNQRFVLEKTECVEGTRTLSDGYYKIQTKLDTNKVIDIGDFSKDAHTKVALWSSNNGYNQRFKIEYRENGFYTIIVAHSGKALDLSNDGKTIEQDDIDYSEEQEWSIKKDSNGLYYIVSAHNGLCFNVQSNINGSNIIVSRKNNTINQYFAFPSIDVEIGSKTISNGRYQINTYLNKDKVIDIEGSSNSSEAKVEIWNKNSGNNQKFNIVYQGNGYYKIIAVHSGKALGVECAGSGSSVNVKQYNVSNSSNQDWIIKSCGSGYYNIISAYNGLYLNVTESNIQNGTRICAYSKNNGANQKFKFEEAFIVQLTSGTYGSSGLKIKGDSRGQLLKYYKIGNGPNVYFATFAVHGWEDLYNNDGQALTKIAEDFKNKLIDMQDENLAKKWTIYIFPSVNPDGEYYGWTHNGPGRTTLYSKAPYNKGIDINRNWSTGYTKYTTDRNYNGTEAFQAYEAQALRDFLLSKRATNGQTILVDLHGWLNETIGDNGVGSYYRSQYGINTHIDTYGKGYLVNWARTNLGYNGRTARSALVELPEWDSNSSKYINATINMLRNIV